MTVFESLSKLDSKPSESQAPSVPLLAKYTHRALVASWRRILGSGGGLIGGLIGGSTFKFGGLVWV